MRECNVMSNDSMYCNDSMYVCMYGWMDGWMYECTDLCMYVCMNE